MKKLTLLLLLICSTNVLAEWTRVTGSSDGDMTVYVDFGTIKRKENKVKMWYLYDLKTIKKTENIRYLSTISHNEYDCEEETSRMLDYYWYSGNMKNGDMVYSSTNLKNEPIAIIPNTINEILFKIACSK